ncbi:MAG: DNA polymerase III subunit delta [Alphaproteobacteria bacterium]|jgi:DNA polymerase-3 subunit delta|nr:DNA polymerase III subunit delta [Alphaproteobacteria bacterium]
MKLNSRQIEAFLARPDPVVVAVLFYGPDRGRVAERSRRLLETVVAAPDDPFSVTELTAAAVKADPAGLADAVGALTLSGERRVVRVKGTDAALAGSVADVLESAAPGDAVLIVEAGELAARDKLRKLFEAAPGALAVPCYLDEGGNLAAAVEAILGEHGLGAEPAALAYLVENLGSDRLVTRSELEKLALYKGDDLTSVTLEEVQACIGDGAPFLVEDAVLASASGNQRDLERALRRCLEAGQGPITLLRAAVRHLQRLHLAAAAVARGESPEQAIKRLRPPVFFKQQGIVRGQLGLWSLARLGRALELLTEAEIQCKTTGMPAEAVAHRALMQVAAAARAAGR